MREDHEADEADENADKFGYAMSKKAVSSLKFAWARIRREGGG